MKKKIYLLFFVSFFAITTHAQVTIGSQDAPNRGAVLELKSDTLGFLPPRIALSKLSLPDPLPLHVKGIVVFNTTDNPADTLLTGLYYNTGIKWMRLSTVQPFLEDWLYMPSVVFDTSQKGPGSKDLYHEYVKQFTSPGAKSDGAPDYVLPILPQATDLYYYITDYDDAVFSNIVIDANGLMTYDIIDTASDATFLNIVFVIK